MSRFVPRSRALASGLLLLSGVTHASQLIVYDITPNVLGAATFGAIYFLVGLFLRRPARWPLWLGAILPTLGGSLGAYRFLHLHRNPFTVLHVAIDLIVIPICIYWLVAGRRSRKASR